MVHPGSILHWWIPDSLDDGVDQDDADQVERLSHFG